MLNSSKLLKKSILNCDKCPLIARSRSRSVPGFGKEDANIMLIGLAPGKDGADLTGIPFTRDPSGLLLDEMLRNAGISRELDVYITNLVKCNPRDNKDRNRPPSNNEIQSCWPFLKKEIEMVQPKLIISLGKSASDFFIRERSKSMKEIHGKEYKLDDKIVIPFIHPGYVIRGAYNKNKYLDEFKKIGELYRKIIEKELRLSRLDFILMVLKNSGSQNENGEIWGKTRLQKYVFLAQDKLKRRGYKAKYAFRPYYYGPFSRQLYTDIEWLRINEMIDITSDYSLNGNISKYEITIKGLNEINDIIKNNELDDVDNIIFNTLNDYKKFTLPKLLEFVHKEFEEYHLQQKPNIIGTKVKTLDEYIIKREI